MANEPNSQPSGDGGQPGGTADPQQPGQGQQGGQAGQPGQPGVKILNEPITPTILSGIMTTRDQKLKDELRVITQGLTDKLATVSKTLEELGTKLNDSPGRSKKDAEPGIEDPKVVEMRRQLKDQNEQVSSLQRNLEQTKRDASAYKRRTALIDALVRAKCTKPEKAFMILDPLIQENPDTHDLYGVEDLGEIGKRNVAIDDYIGRVFSEREAPEFFPGKLRAGSPAGGDSGASGQTYDYSIDDFRNDPTLYSRDPEKARRAFEQGRVKGASSGKAAGVR